MSAENKKNSGSVLFVCLGNICRSPIAEAVFAQLVREKGLDSRWRTDSAASSDWNVGRKPDQRGRQLMKKKKVDMNHEARQISTDDFYAWDFILAMDDDNMRNLSRVRPSDATSVVQLLGDYDPEGVKVIEDPYYGDERDFETVYDQCMRCCGAFLDQHS